MCLSLPIVLNESMVLGTRHFRKIDMSMRYYAHGNNGGKMSTSLSVSRHS